MAVLAELADRVGLSEQGRHGLHRMRLQAEGYKVTGIGTRHAQRIARHEFVNARRGGRRRRFRERELVDPAWLPRTVD